MRVPFSNKIATKMLFAFFIVILIPAFCSSVFIYYFASTMIKSHVRQSTLQIAEQTADSISFAFNYGSDVSDQLYSDTKIQQAVLAGRVIERLPPQDELNAYVNDTLNNIVYSSSFVKIIYILQETGISWGSGTFNPNKLDLNGPPWAQEAEEEDGGYVWLGLQHDRLSGGGDNTALVLPFVRVLKDFRTMENIGLMVVSLDGEALLEKITRIEFGETGRFFVTDEAGTIVIDPDLRMVNRRVANDELARYIVSGRQAEFEFTMDGVAYYGVKQVLSNGWNIVGIVPIHEMTGQLDTLLNRIFFSSLLFSGLAVLVALLIAGKITRPIKLLVRQMKQVGDGDLQARTEIRSADELGVLSKQFNSMIHRVDALIRQVREEQARKQEAEIRALHYRINPHFLFNTLTNLRWLVKYNQTDKADQGITALIRLLEANMGKKGNFVTVEEELDIIRKFLVIHELRYHVAFTFMPQMDPAVLAMKIPRMLLQPIVENSIFHGIVPKGSDGRIEVTGERRRDGAVVFTIRDDGRGIEFERMCELSNMDDAVANGRVGIGIRHVYESMRLYYSSRSALHIDGEPGKGAVTTLMLVPKEGERVG